ncbi:hypothetical protein, partial [Gardnerella vaginalis]|uniref:hypothetical protein n=1 Tax=Gardnerella vaginalis TaxID=2702 RepID=UPI003970DF6E
VLIGMSSIRVVNTTSNYQKAKLITSISRIFISLALHTFWPITPIYRYNTGFEQLYPNFQQINKNGEARKLPLQ